jgi:hypothetical protein
MVIAACDRTGTERGQEWTGGTTVIGSDGWPLAVPDADGNAHATLDLAATHDKAISPRNDLIADRRPSIYRGARRYSPFVTGDRRQRR